MTRAMMRGCSFLLWAGLLFTFWLCAPKILAQTTPGNAPGTVSGTVLDPEGALVRAAKIALISADHLSQATQSDDFGVFRFPDVAPGRYTITAQATGFSLFALSDVDVQPGQNVRLNLRIRIEVQQQQVQISGQTLDTSPDQNASAMILRRPELDTLPDNPQDLQLQLQVMAGSDPESPTQFYVDGFTSGKLPPKSAIREIRINENPYSAEYDKVGFSRVEIFTKPGTEKLHGDLFLLGNDSALNSRNPYVSTQPSYSSVYALGDVNGPLSKFASYFLSVESQRYESQSFIHAVTTPGGAAYDAAVPSPQTGLDLTPRFDFQAGKDQTVTVRYEINRATQDDLLSSSFSLPSQAISTRNVQQTLQISDTQMYGAHVVNETRFQYVRTRNHQIAASSLPTIVVQGAFTGGGNNLGTVIDKQDQYELQNYASVAAGAHFLRFGGRWRATRDSNDSNADFNGQYIFSSLDDYAAGKPSLFSLTTGQSKIAILAQDLGLYAEDEWKLHPNMTLAYGLRFETQNHIHDHADFAPRLSYSWAIGATDKKAASTILRAGAGIFYNRFTPDLVLTAERQNGIVQQEYLVENPSYPNFPPPNGSSSPTIYRIAPLLHAPYTAEESIEIDETLRKILTLSATWQYSRGIDLLLTRNINAPLPGTFPASPVRPLGTNENIYEYESEGASKRNRLLVRFHLTTGPVLLYGSWTLGWNKANTAGPASFPSNQYDLHADWGRASNDIRAQGYLGGVINLPWSLQATPFLVMQSATPFNITIGQDLNGDAQFNDRPAFATDLNRPSVYRTRYGNFDADPLPGQTIVPINYANGPSQTMLNFTLLRSIGFGPAVQDSAPAAPAAAGGKKKKTPVERKYNLALGFEAQNILNNVNPAPPVGVLESPLFGQYTALSSSLFSSTEANRIFYLNLRLSF
ncbi:TonB-dependent receptor [Paracidobacterium acidisoli]|nr:TonB-dependent receptor [Paracidobacterium acidisoli]MBT9333204.1 carboxypeptidase regulatory-like domain-containing protein [Paracidobacterium acidisoli]